MRALKLILATAGLTAALGCTAATKNVPHGSLNPSRFALTGVTFSDTTPTAGDDVTGTINFMGVSGPFTFAITFSNSVTPLFQTVTAPSGATSASFTFTIDPFLLADDPDGKVISVSVTSTDANGSVGTVTGTLTVGGTPNQPPDDGGDGGGDPAPEPEPEPEPVDLNAERLARIESSLRREDPRSLDTADLLWYHHYWGTHTPDQTAPSTFPVAGESLISAVDFVAPNTLRIALDAVVAGDYHRVWVEGEDVRAHSYSGSDPTAELILYIDLIGPPRRSLPITVHARREQVEEALAVRIPAPRLNIAVEATNTQAQIVVTGDDALSHNGTPQLGSSQVPINGAYVEHTTQVSPGVETHDLSFVPRGPQVPALLVVGRSAFWRYRSALIEFSGLPVKGWNYDYAAGILHVTARHNSVQLGLSLPGGVELTAPAGSADFTVPSAESTYPAQLHVRDGADESTYPLRLGNAAGNIPHNTLRAWPLQTSVGVGEPVRILVASGLTAHPFQYMTGVRLVFPADSGMQYVKRSFNVGAPGGKKDDVDGGWDAVQTEDFLLAPESFYHSVDAGTDPLTGDALLGIDFNVTPLNAENAYFEGELFNCELSFASPGAVDIGFQLFNIVNRCYYQDGNQAPDYFWTDISNAEVDSLPSPTLYVN